jgi:hypothetical protein
VVCFAYFAYFATGQIGGMSPRWARAEVLGSRLATRRPVEVGTRLRDRGGSYWMARCSFIKPGGEHCRNDTSRTKPGNSEGCNTTDRTLAMAWESRERGGHYYTRSRRVNGRVVREYIGGGELARIASEIDADRRAQRDAERQQQRAELKRLEVLAGPVGELCEVTEILVRVHLVALGYRKHKGEWRRERRA